MLWVNEIFHSIQGESTHAGRPCIFIRLTGCNLRCVYCDTEYAKEAGASRSIDEILERIGGFQCRLVEITGGEPLHQKDTPALCSALLNAGYDVLVETNGSKNINALPEGIKRIMDVKCPASGESALMDWENIRRLRTGDEIKFVLSDRVDYDWALSRMKALSIPGEVPVLFSPVQNRLDAEQLSNWMIEDGLNVRLQLQLHKLIWPRHERGV